MKTLIIPILSLVTFLYFSCSEDDTKVKNDELTVTISNAELYEYDFKISGDEEGATILTQAKHFQVSEIIRDVSTNWSVVYQYKPQAGFTGEDYVEIQTCTGGQGSGCTDLHTIRINFTVSE